MYLAETISTNTGQQHVRKNDMKLALDFHVVFFDHFGFLCLKCLVSFCKKTLYAGVQSPFLRGNQ